MELRDRYLQAVGAWLPRRERRDIVAELSEDIRSEIDAREAELGRALGRDEVDEILTRWGHPMLVASRYLPQRQLIGPVLLPAYVFVLKLAALCWLVPWLLVGIGLAIFDPARGAAPGELLHALWMMALQAFTAITVIFALVERHHARVLASGRWRAKELVEGTARDPDEIPRFDSLAEMVVTAAFTWWWWKLRSMPSTFENGEAAFRLTIAALQPWIYWSIFVLLAGTIALAAFNLARPWWTRRRAAAHLALELLGVVLAAVLIAAAPLIDLAGDIPAEQLGNLQTLAAWVNRSWYATIAAAGLICVAGAVQAALRTAGRKPWAPPRLWFARRNMHA